MLSGLRWLGFWHGDGLTGLVYLIFVILVPHLLLDLDDIVARLARRHLILMIETRLFDIDDRVIGRCGIPIVLWKQGDFSLTHRHRVGRDSPGLQIPAPLLERLSPMIDGGLG